MKVRFIAMNELRTVCLFLFSFLCLISSRTIKAETIIEKQLAELDFKIQTLPPHSLQIEISKLRAIKDVKITATSSYVPNPARIVIDIKGVKVSKNQTIQVNNSEVKAVRLGVHPDYCRLVIDLSADGAINSAIEQTADNLITLAFSVKKSAIKNPQNYHQPVKSEPSPTAIRTAEALSTATPKNTATPVIAKSTATPVKKTPTPKATKTTVAEKINAVATQKIVTTMETKAPIVEENSAALPVRKVPAPPPAVATQTAIPPLPTVTPQATSTKVPVATTLPAALEEAPLSSLIEGKANPADIPANKQGSASDPLSHSGLGGLNEQGISAPIGPKDASQYLVEVRFDYQIQDHDPLLRLVMMSGANFNLVKKDSQLYQLIIAKSGIKNKELAQPLFPPHDFVGFTLVHPRYENDSLIIDIGVDRGARISAFARGNEIWVRGVTK
jgi:hypothetical protein